MLSTSRRFTATLAAACSLGAALLCSAVPCIGHTSGSGTATWFTSSFPTACSEPALAPSEYVTAVASDIWDGSMACGKCLEITGAVGTVVARIAEYCPSCPAGGLDLNEATFEAAVGPSLGGAGAVSWKTVPCPGAANVRVKLATGTNPYYVLVQHRLSRYGIESMELRASGSSTWLPMASTTYNAHLYQPGGTPAPTPLSLRLTDVHGQTITLSSIIPNYTAEIEYSSSAQFPLCDEDAVTDVELMPGGGLGTLRALPNPLAADTVLSCLLPFDAQASLGIYDARGRLARQLFEGVSLSAGAQRFAWDGRDDRGTALRAGVYYARLDFGRERLTAKLMVLR